MAEHGLDGWTFAWINSARTLGSCKFSTRTLSFTRWLIDTPEHDQRDTVLHEIAHALAGPAAMHGPAWRATARRVGAEPRHCTASLGVRAAAPRGTWSAVCPDHGVVASQSWHRKPSARRLHKGCGQEVDYIRETP